MTKNSKLESQKNKVMLVTLFDSQGTIHTELVPPDLKVNKDYYVEVLSLLVKRIRGVRTQFQERGSWFLLKDNPRHIELLGFRTFSIVQSVAKVPVIEISSFQE
jgi:hypothetical protein